MSWFPALILLATVPAGEALTPAESMLAEQVAQHVSGSEWLGALAPVALSPFFGITCLAGLAQFGGDWFPAHSLLLQKSTVLNHPAVFWVFLVLTLVTSLPRFTKVSKPIAQALDQLEAWSGLITLLVVRLLLWTVPAGDAAPPEVVQAGFLSVSADVLLILAGILNFLVINAVKFFFECLVWITPLPLLDACFELANKALCLGLAILYGYSPFAATIANLLLFGVCLLIFRWANRRVLYFRTLLLDPIWAAAFPGYSQPGTELVVFPQRAFGPFPACIRLTLQRTGSGWKLCQPRLVGRSPEVHIPDHVTAVVSIGLLGHSLTFEGSDLPPMTFSRRHMSRWNEFLEAFRFRMGQ